MPVQMKIDFYRVAMPEGTNSSFEDIIKAVNSSPDDESRNVMIRGYPVRLQESHFGHEYVEGNLSKNRMNALPPKLSLKGKMSPLDLQDDEGLGEETAFLYSPGLRVLAIQRNRYGISASAFAAYFQVRGHLGAPIVLEPVLEANAYSRLANLKEAKRLAIRFAGVTNPEVFRDTTKGEAISNLIDVLEYFRAPSANIVLSMGRLPGSLFLKGIDNLYKYIVDKPEGGEIQKLEVSGITEDDEKEVFDLLAYRMVESVPVDENSKRRITYKRRRPSLQEAWSHRRQELAKLFG